MLKAAWDRAALRIADVSCQAVAPTSKQPGCGAAVSAELSRRAATRLPCGAGQAPVVQSWPDKTRHLISRLPNVHICT